MKGKEQVANKSVDYVWGWGGDTNTHNTMLVNAQAMPATHAHTQTHTLRSN